MSRLFFSGRWIDGDERAVLEQKYTGEQLAEIHCASTSQVATAVADLERASANVIGAYDRFEILSAASRLLQERRETFVDLIVAEAGFARRDANTEVDRSIQTLRLSGEEAARLTGEMVPLEGAPDTRDRIGYTMRVPVGVVCAITPFNSPLNTVAHKVGPALAASNTVILKPASATPLTAAALVSILLDAGLPPSHIALVHGSGRTVGQTLLEHPAVGFYTFTGSTEVGRAIQRTVGLRRTQLELGSLSSTIVCQDADIDTAAEKCTSAAFRKAGQVCTSVQRVYVHRDVAGDFADQLVAGAASQVAGDPAAEETTVGPLISQGEAERVASWVSAAVDGGADLLHGGALEDRVVTPAVLTKVDPSMQVMCEEVFGPVVSLSIYDDLEAAITEINATPYGLACGIFTYDMRRALKAADALHFGSVHINETSSSRLDLMPYGGVKDSGFGHEGPKYAAREMTEERLVTINYC